MRLELDNIELPSTTDGNQKESELEEKQIPYTPDEEKMQLKKKKQANFAQKILVIFAYCYIAMLPTYLILQWAIIRVTVPQGDIPWELIIGINAVILLCSFLWLLATTFIGMKSLEILLEFLGQGVKK